ncbi:MAG: inorganic phosphate transporter [Christensenellaceae bacterium]|nr:inorganic phosphate transporter [Christensenellaceae bacterium]
MTVTLSEFFQELVTNLPFAICTVIMLSVIMVNGWTDAANAIATCVGTRALAPHWSIVLAAVFNFLGALTMTLLNGSVAYTIYNMVDFSGDPHSALIALMAGLAAIVIWAVGAWLFGINTSESHALIAGISGAAIALQNGFGGINPAEWVKVLYGLVLSTVLGFGSGYVITKITEGLCKNMDRRKTTPFFKYAQIGGAAGMSFMHGAQDGQKFMGVFMLGMFLSRGMGDVTDFAIPIWLMVLCSGVIALGTSIGGYRIIKSVGMSMVSLEKYQGFCADAASSLSLLFSSVVGIPVSTSHMKATSIMGVGAARRLSAINWGVVKEMVMAWILTFPGCGLIGFAMAKLFMFIL